MVGSSFTAVIQPRDTDGGHSHRIFYHDTAGQIFETAIISADAGYKEHSEVYVLRGAVMSVNTSLAATVVTTQINGRPYHVRKR